MNRIVAVPLDESLSAMIGKKGNENSMAFYNRKVGSDIIIAIAPSDMEGKFYALANSMILSEQIIISTSNIDALFGEVLIAASLLNKRIIFTKDSDISAMIKGVGIKDFVLADRGELLASIESYKSGPKEGIVKVDIDRSFNVKGVGTVLLGIVTRGKLKKHDVLLTRSNKEVTVRSIQCQDDDVLEAETNARVGIAAKGIDESDVRKGDVLSISKIVPKDSISITITQSKVANEDLKIGNQYQIFSIFDSGSCVIEEISENNVKLKLDKEFQIEAGDTIMLGRTKRPRIFASGIVK